MPSGTMAQAIALRVHAERRGSKRVAFHPRSHVHEHEELAYEKLHGLEAQLLGSRDRPVATSDIDELEEPVAAVLLELPERELGGLLPAWDDLVASCAKARAKGAAVHLDGARLWQCGPFYERSLDEIADLFDTVYVSFYKDLAAPAGAALAGPTDFIEEARIWQVRHGGRLYSVHPYLIAAERGLDEILPRIPELVAHARELGTALAALDGIEIVPDPPQTTMFHLYVHRPLEPLQEAALDQAEQTGTFLGFIRATDRPEVQRAGADDRAGEPRGSGRRGESPLGGTACLRRAAGAPLTVRRAGRVRATRRRWSQDRLGHTSPGEVAPSSRRKAKSGPSGRGAVRRERPPGRRADQPARGVARPSRRGGRGDSRRQGPDAHRGPGLG